MPAKIRLQRKGKKKHPFYHIVIADGRAPRDGRLVEKIGTYDPMTNPASIELDFEKALHWIQVGAQPTDTAKAILSYKGVMYKNHLLKGVTKGAFTAEKAEILFKEWLADKEARVLAKASGLADSARTEAKKRHEEEEKVNDARKAEFAKVKAEAQAAFEAEASAKAAAKAEEEAKAEVVIEEKAKVEEAAPAKTEEVAPAKVEEATPEAKVKEVAPEAKAKEAAPAKEEAAPEGKAEEPKAEATEETKTEK